jgi:UPF0755 protein
MLYNQAALKQSVGCMKKESKILISNTRDSCHRGNNGFYTGKLLLAVIAGFAAMGILLVFLVVFFFSPIKESFFYKINHGATISSIAVDMNEKGLVVSEKFFKAFLLILGGRVQSGEYEIPAGTGMWRIAKMFNRGNVASIIIMIPEGLTLKQIKNLLVENPAITGDVECAKAPDADKSKESARAGLVCDLKDGDLFPDTYRVVRGADRLSVLELAGKKMESIRLGWENSGKPMPSPLKTWGEVVTLASIVQKETPKASEMPIVASVYLNRLKKKMKLQADPTVVYAITDGLGDMRGQALFTGHLKISNPYNTYVNYGLPPAPIANVGRHAIAAVLNPADTNYLFFVADGQGGHKFSRSYEEHQKNHAGWREMKKSLNSKKHEQWAENREP